MADPIFAAIAEHERRRAEHEAAFDAAGEAELSDFPNGPLAAEAGTRRDAASERALLNHPDSEFGKRARAAGFRSGLRRLLRIG